MALLALRNRSTASPCSFCTEYAASACSSAGPDWAASSAALPAAGVCTAAAAIAQLQSLRGNHARFLTGLCLLNVATGRLHTAIEECTVAFRSVSDVAIARYVERERPLDCAGAFKAEGLGIALFESIHTNDPTTLIGLPLIRLVTMLAAEGVDVLTV